MILPTCQLRRLVPELFTKRRSDIFNCPVDCEVKKYPSSMSYAAVTKSDDNRFALSEEYSDVLQAKVHEALDARENVDKTRWKENFEAVKEAFSDVNETLQSKDGMVFYFSQLEDEGVDIMKRYHRNYDFFMELGFQKMKDIFQKNFVIGWNEMNFNASFAASHQLSAVTMHSPKMMREESWRSAVHLRLAESRAAAMTAMDNAVKVYSAYGRAIPLLNYTATPKGQYDSFYLRPLFIEVANVSEVYTSVSQQLSYYVNITDALIRMTNCSDDDVDQNYLDRHAYYTSQRQSVFENYLRYMKQYETFIIDKPLQRIATAKIGFMTNGFLYQALFPNLKRGLEYLGLYRNEITDYIDYLKSIGTYLLLSSYYEKFEQRIHASMIQLAQSTLDFDTMELIHKVYDDAVYNVRNLRHDIDVVQELICAMLHDAESEPLLAAVFSGMDKDFYDHYFKLPDCEDGEKTKMCVEGGTNYVKMIMLHKNVTCNKVNGTDASFEFSMDELRASRMTKLQKKLQSLKEERRLDGNFHRYVLQYNLAFLLQLYIVRK